MNNKPITARVKSGMFKTKEPLLNVGPAGVDGNNKTRAMPSPSKMKGYAMKSSPFKQESQAEKNVDEAIKSETSLSFDGAGGAAGVRETTTTIPGKEGKAAVAGKVTGQMSGKKMSDADWKKYLANESAEKKAARHKREEDAGVREKGTDAVAGTPDEVVKTKVKGDTFRKSEGDAQSAYNRRENIRASKVTGRQKKRQTIKQGRLTDKLAGIDKEKNPGKYRRVKAKLQQATDRLGVATSEAENVANQSKQNIKAGSTKNTRGADVKNTAADWDKNTQIENLDSSTPAEMNKPGFFKKKSPMKMNYFKK